MSDWKLQTRLGEKFGASVNYLDQLGKCDRIYHKYDKYVRGKSVTITATTRHKFHP